MFSSFSWIWRATDIWLNVSVQKKPIRKRKINKKENSIHTHISQWQCFWKTKDLKHSHISTTCIGTSSKSFIIIFFSDEFECFDRWRNRNHSKSCQSKSNPYIRVTAGIYSNILLNKIVIICMLCIFPLLFIAQKPHPLFKKFG